MVADIPPALYINYLRIKNSFKDLKIVMCNNAKTKEELEKLIHENDVLFVFPHQLEFFNENFFNISIAIDCLHEMEKKTIKKYMQIFNKKSQFLYYKVLSETYVPYDYNNYLNANSEGDYQINANWDLIFKEKCICPSDYTEIAYKI